MDFDAVFSPNISDFEYETNAAGTEITITNYFGYKTDIIIPAKINNLPVKHIGDRAFANNILISIGDGMFRENKLTSVIIPDSVISIGDGAFFINSLTSVTIPASVETINDAVFAWNRLTSIMIPDGVKSIGRRAFAQNPLTHIVIPNSVTSIEWEAFVGVDPANVVIPDSVEDFDKYDVFYTHYR